MKLSCREKQLRRGSLQTFSLDYCRSATASKALRMTTSDPAWLSAFQQVLDSDPQNKFVQVATVSTAAADRFYLLQNANTVWVVTRNNMLNIHHCRHGSHTKSSSQTGLDLANMMTFCMIVRCESHAGEGWL